MRVCVPSCLASGQTGHVIEALDKPACRARITPSRYNHATCRHWSRGQMCARLALGTPLQFPSQRHFTSTKPSLRGICCAATEDSQAALTAWTVQAAWHAAWSLLYITNDVCASTVLLPASTSHKFLFGQVKELRPPGRPRSSFNDGALGDCQNCWIGRPYRNAQDRLLWKDRTCPARTLHVMSWKAN